MTALDDMVHYLKWFVRPRPAWFTQAECRGIDANLFHPTDKDGNKAGRADIAAAKRVCNVCPVRAECLEYALDLAMFDGVYGGTTGRERRQIARNRTTAV